MKLPQYAIVFLTFASTLAIRIWDLDRHFWLLEDQIRDWGIALRPLSELPFTGSPTHVGGYTIGPAFYWILWCIRIVIGPWFDNLPHAGGIGQAALQSAADALLLVAVWRRTDSLPIALTAAILLATPSYDIALSGLVWNPMAGAALAKVATALVVMRWPERSHVTTALTAGIAWSAVQCYTGAVFMALGVFAALLAPSARTRDWGRLARTAAVIAVAVALLQVPWALHQISTKFANNGMTAVSGSIGQVVSGERDPQFAQSWNGYKSAFNQILVFPWQAQWPFLLLLVCAAVVSSRFRRDPALLCVVVLPQLLAVAGYAFYVGDFLDHYYYFSLMPAAVLTLTLALTALRPRRVLQFGAIAALAGALAITPARVRTASTLMRMPQYASLVEGSRTLAAQGEPLRDIRTEFALPPTSNARFVFEILGGRIDGNARRVGVIKSDGRVEYAEAGSL